MEQLTKRLLNKLIIIVLIGIVLTFISCDKDDNGYENEFPDIIAGRGLFIINEGNYGWGNASLGYIDTDNNTSYHNLFEKANNRALGDVFQSISMINDKLFLVVNNSGKIEIVDPVSIKSKGVIQGLTSPRNIVQVNDDVALISDLYADKIFIVSLDDYSIVDFISVSGWTEDIIVANNKILVANVDNNLVYEIDKHTLELKDSILTAPMPVRMLKGNDNMAWVLCAGDIESNEKGSIMAFDINGLEVLEYVEIEAIPFANMAFSRDKEILYVLKESLYEISVENPEIPDNPLISASGMLFYGLAVDPANGDIYVADAVDYVQRGVIFRYNSSGTFVSKFDSGIIPGGFFFN